MRPPSIGTITLGTDWTVAHSELSCFGLEPTVGTRVELLFDESCRDAIQIACGEDWRFCDEESVTLITGHEVLVCAEQLAKTHRLTLVDRSSHAILASARHRAEVTHAVRSLAGATARELNDPMAIVQGRLELLAALSAADERVNRHIQVALDHARRVSNTLKNLRMVGRGERDAIESVPVPVLIEQALGLLGGRATEICVEPHEPFRVGGEQALYVRLLAALMRRMLSHTRRRDQLTLTVTADDDHVLFSLGICDPSGRPIGLRRDWDDPGLVDILLQGAGGHLRKTDSRVVLVLPAPPGSRSRAKRKDTPLLVVGSEWLVEHLGPRLEREGYVIQHRSDAREALRWLQAGERPAAVVCELLLTGPSGIALSRAVAQDYGLPVALISDGPVRHLPELVTVIGLPVMRVPLLQALGRAARRRS